MSTMTGSFAQDHDLDALMVRVREAALRMSGNSATDVANETPAEAAGPDDFIKVIDAQGRWNENTRQALGELAGCLRTLQSDWADVQKDLRNEIARLTARVRRLQRTRDAATVRHTSAAGHRRTARTPAARRPSGARRAATSGKPRT